MNNMNEMNNLSNSVSNSVDAIDLSSSDRAGRYGRKVLGKDLSFTMDTWRTGHNNNVCVIAGSGHGKTTGFVQPNLQAALESGTSSLVVADTKGQLVKHYRRAFEDKGYLVYCLDFDHPEKSDRYDPLRYVRRHSDGSLYEKDVLTVANAVEAHLDDREPYWDQTAVEYLSFLIAYVLDSDLPKEDRSMMALSSLHHTFLQPNGDMVFGKWVKKHSNSFAARKYNEIAALKNADRTYASVMSFASTSLQCFDFSEAEHIFGTSNPRVMDLEALGRQKTVLFINSSDVDYTFTRLSALFYDQLFQVLTSEADKNPDGVLDVPVDIYMDDFTSSASAIQDFDKLISVVRSRDISVNIMLQSLSQLEQMYGHPAAMTIIDNCDTLLYMGGNSHETAEFIGERAFRTPENILCALPREKMWVIPSGEKARLADRILAGSYPVPASEAEEVEVDDDLLLDDLPYDDEYPDCDDEGLIDGELPFC